MDAWETIARELQKDPDNSVGAAGGAEELEGENVALAVALKGGMAQKILQEELSGANKGGVDGAVMEDLEGEGSRGVEQEARLQGDLHAVVPNGVWTGLMQHSGRALRVWVYESYSGGVHLPPKKADVLQAFCGHDGQLYLGLWHGGGFTGKKHRIDSTLPGG